jgi:hypothetical protein
MNACSLEINITTITITYLTTSSGKAVLTPIHTLTRARSKPQTEDDTFVTID